RTREGDREARGGGRGLSRGAEGTYPRARSTGRRRRAISVLRSLRLGSGRAGRRVWRRRLRPVAPRWRNGPASAFRAIGRQRRTISVLRLGSSGSGQAGRRVWRRRSRPIAPRWSNGPASAHHIGTTSRNRIWLGILLC